MTTGGVVYHSDMRAVRLRLATATAPRAGGSLTRAARTPGTDTGSIDGTESSKRSRLAMLWVWRRVAVRMGQGLRPCAPASSDRPARPVRRHPAQQPHRTASDGSDPLEERRAPCTATPRATPLPLLCLLRRRVATRGVANPRRRVDGRSEKPAAAHMRRARRKWRALRRCVGAARLWCAAKGQPGVPHVARASLHDGHVSSSCT